jgi:NAD(P)-dependent dehydrogenase (short-subunit alcohol dehydrogenase family)
VSDAVHAMHPSLAGRRVVVTGGGSGIGAAIVRGFLRQKARVAFIDIAAEDSRSLLERLAAEGLDAPLYLDVDLRDTAATTKAFEQILAGFGGIDVLVNNAASDDRHELASVTPDYWDERIAINLRHLFVCAQAAIPSMRARHQGVILNLGSISWHLGLKDLVVYQTAKAGIEGMTRALARELGRDGIRVNAIIPGNVQTPRQMRWYNPAEEAQLVAAQCLDGRIQPDDVASMALFLASDDARMCTGHAYWVDAGWR